MKLLRVAICAIALLVCTSIADARPVVSEDAAMPGQSDSRWSREAHP